MKPCSKNRKLLAWLALGELDVRRAADIREHTRTCDACRRYLEEMAMVNNELKAAEIRPDVQVSVSFHRNLVARLRVEPSGSLWANLAAQLAATRLSWRFAFPVIGTAALAIAVLSMLLRQPHVSPPGPTSVQAVASPDLERDLAPTLSNYQRVASRSLEELDALLTRQAERNPSPTPNYTASIFASAHALD